jgi:hypothetical protein
MCRVRPHRTSGWVLNLDSRSPPNSMAELPVYIYFRANVPFLTCVVNGSSFPVLSSGSVRF